MNNMKNLLIRSLSGIIYVSVLAGSAILHPFAYTVVLSFFLILASIELMKLTHADLAKKYSSIFAMINLSLFWLFAFLFEITALLDKSSMLFIILPITALSIACLLIIILIFMSLNKKSSLSSIINSFSLSFVYILIPFLSLLMLIKVEIANFDFSPVLFLFGIIWINDTFAYLGGMIFGKTALAPKISPKKTIEGLISGFIFSLAAALILNNFYGEFNIAYVVLFVIIITGLGTLGDLIESKLKREAGVKDSGNIIPGHGGILDRFDSLLLAAPAALILLFFLI